MVYQACKHVYCTFNKALAISPGPGPIQAKVVNWNFKSLITFIDKQDATFDRPLVVELEFTPREHDPAGSDGDLWQWMEEYSKRSSLQVTYNCSNNEWVTLEQQPHDELEYLDRTTRRLLWKSSKYGIPKEQELDFLQILSAVEILPEVLRTERRLTADDFAGV